MSDLPADNSAARPVTISGKRITIVVLVTLLVTGLLFYWVATSYSTYNAARRQTDRSWRALATVLDERYQQYDAQVVRAREEQQLDAAAAESWREARDSFSRTTLPTEQAEAARRLESTIATLPESFRVPGERTGQVQDLAQAYVTAASTQRTVGQHAGSRMLKLMLRLPEPPDFSLAD